MPSKSAKQHRLMLAAAHDPAIAAKAGIPQKAANGIAKEECAYAELCKNWRVLI